jgi:hypothetical protein
MKREDFIKMYSKKRCLGDGLYVHFDGYHFILSAERENGWHWVGLEPPVFEQLIQYRKQVYIDAELIEKDEI